jgi:hypothetical protein
MNSIIIDCDECVVRATSACTDCLVTYLCDRQDPAGHAGTETAIVFDLAEQRAVRWFAEAGMVPTLRHRAAANA